MTRFPNQLCILTLDSNCVRVMSPTASDVDSVRGRMCPPARISGALRPVDWTLLVRRSAATQRADMGGEEFSHAASGWPRLIITERRVGGITAVGRYRDGHPVVRIDVDRQRRRTILSIPNDPGPAVRWVDWLVRLFFGTHMLCTRWRLMHASCVGLGGKAILFGGPAGVGKSSLAYLTCARLGATFMSDDLTLLRVAADDLHAVGWPTRVSIPEDVADLSTVALRESRAMSAGWQRRRWLLSPPEFAAVTGFRRGGLAPVAAAVLLGQGPADTDVSNMAAEPDQELFMTDVLGLMGKPTSTPQESSRPVVSWLLKEIPVFSVSAGFPVADAFSDVSAFLRSVLANGSLM